ncbi:TRAP transporter substrate-binding protein (plasmid) [Nitratireductor sp. L1-7-SE]|uniref:TRAP transporter substrate-binding protein n=1 Tax=Nitratireductor rhodophyticola TaxID=2854036 RepID=A0ABS7RDI3_9HYPH|nr:TRAP transporter substrate-binding protein [Nitratireductor rhodophyticola]MBY8918445.1 TRAP transporter substrate-binding protein [Nitratireductor rhodophyticola]MBY8922788.1 TRAP transporter substrate-binding protein [Nitratireductor rhodophyticola]
MNRILRNLLAAGVMTAIGAASTVSAQAETWRMAHKMPPDSIEGELFQFFADKVVEKTGGEVEIKVFPNEQLGSDDTVLEQLQIGTVNVYPEGTSYLQKWVPDIKFTSAPFLFDDREHWVRFMQTDLVKGWFKQIEDEAGIALIGSPTAFLRGPYRVMVTDKPWTNLEEMQGTRLRMHPDELAAAAWRHLGAEVRTLAWTEVYESISRGIVDAVNSPIALVEPMKFYEVASHIIRHDEYPQGMAFMTNAKRWNALSDELRAQVLDAFAEMAEESEKRMIAAANSDLEAMKAKDVAYTEPDTSDFVERMQSFYQEMEEKGELPEGFLDAVRSSRAE